MSYRRHPPDLYIVGKLSQVRFEWSKKRVPAEAKVVILCFDPLLWTAQIHQFYPPWHPKRLFCKNPTEGRVGENNDGDA